MKPHRTTIGAATAAACGALVAIAIAQAHRMPGEDVAVLVLVAAGAATAAGLLGAFLLRIARRSPVAQQALVVVLTPVLATALGAGLAAKAMFVSGHHLAARN